MHTTACTSYSHSLSSLVALVVEIVDDLFPCSLRTTPIFQATISLTTGCRLQLSNPSQRKHTGAKVEESNPLSPIVGAIQAIQARLPDHDMSLVTPSVKIKHTAWLCLVTTNRQYGPTFSLHATTPEQGNGPAMNGKDMHRSYKQIHQSLRVPRLLL